MNKRLTPIMGWASWNCFRTDITEEKMKAQIDALVDCGLAEYGYEYVNMDDGFFGGRDEKGTLKFHKERFPNGIKVIADYAHSKGLKAGTYAEGGDKTCGFYYDNEGENGDSVGLYGYEEQDLKMYLEDFGFDFIKVDWCGGLRLGLSEREQYTKIGDIIEEIRQRTGKPIVYNICRWQFPGAWAVDTANSWRTGADIEPNFKSVLHQVDNIKRLAKYCGQGHVNDLDMMQLGNGMREEEEKTHFAMWCMMSTPLIVGCDLTKIKESTLNILKNKELIAINQDIACLQAYVIKELDGGEVWIKDLGKETSARKAVAVLNRSDEVLNVRLNLADAGLTGEIKSVRDVCNHNDLECSDVMEISVVPRGVNVYVIESENAQYIPDRYAQEVLEPEKVPCVSYEDAMELSNNGAILVDARSKQEYENGHLKDAINVPYTEIHANAESIVQDKNIPIIVYCTTGKRSLQARDSLVYLGYRNVYYLGGVEV